MVFHALYKVFRNPGYSVLSILIALGTYAAVILLPNTRLIVIVSQSSSATLLEKFQLIVSLFGSIMTNFSGISATYTILIALLFGMNVGMITFFLQNRMGSFGGSAMASGGLGTVAAILGIGCAACGSFLLTTILAWVGAGALIAILPLKGAEFGIAAVLLLGTSLYLASKKITDPLTCRA